MTAAVHPWQALVAAMSILRPAIRVKWSGDDQPTTWESWVIIPAPGYLETGSLGPIPFREVEWIEVDPAERRDEIATALDNANIAYTIAGSHFRISGITGKTSDKL